MCGSDEKFNTIMRTLKHFPRYHMMRKGRYNVWNTFICVAHQTNIHAYTYLYVLHISLQLYKETGNRSMILWKETRWPREVKE